MSRKRKEQIIQQKRDKRKRMIRSTIIGTVVLCACVGVVVAVSFVGRPANIKVSLEDGALVVPMSKLSSKTGYIRYGGSQDLLVYKDANGNIHTAFDTCQECFSYGARYTVSGDELTCSYCRNTYDTSYLGMESWGGCQPVAIPASYRADTDSALVIPAEVLEYASGVFRAWRTGDYSATMQDYSTNTAS